jgi:hypothetical protein
MTFYIFACSKDRTLYGATDEPTGAKLPKGACPGGTWSPRKQLKESRIGFSATKAAAAIKKQGYYLFHVKITTSIRTAPKP